MTRKISVFFLLCMAALLPAIAEAQFFAKQKVVVWEVFDRNNDVKVADATKTQIRTAIVDAFVNSRNYEVFEGNMNDVKNRISAKGLTASSVNIAKIVRELYKVDFVLFTTINVIQHATSYDNYQVHLASDLYSAETQKSERMAYVDMKSDVKEIPAACAKLLSNLLGEQLTAQEQPVQPEQQQPAHTQPTQHATSSPTGTTQQSAVVDASAYGNNDAGSNRSASANIQNEQGIKPTPKKGEVVFYLPSGYQPKKEKHKDRPLFVEFDNEKIGSGTLSTGFTIRVPKHGNGVHRLEIIQQQDFKYFKVDLDKYNFFEFQIYRENYFGIPMYGVSLKEQKMIE